MDERQLLGKRLFFITAHPDDETFAAAGTLYRNAREGGVNAVLCATFGEKGSSHLQEKLTEDELAELRKNELLIVSEFLGIRHEYVFLPGVPDTKVTEHVDNLHVIALKHSREFKPDVIVGFDRCGITGHVDHIAMSLVAERVAAELDIELATFTLPDTVLREHANIFKQRQKQGMYTEAQDYHFPDIIIPIDSEVKLKALQMHASQYDTDNPLKDMPSALVDTIIHNEYFVLHSKFK